MKKWFVIWISGWSMLAAQAQDTIRWSLQDCITYAIANNITVKSAALNKQTAEVNYQQQKNNKLPSFNGSTSLNASRGSNIDPITSDFVNRTILSNSYGIQGNMVLYQGGRLNLQIDKNELLLQQSELYQKEAENNIMLNVIETYLQALYYQEGITIAENAVASSQEEVNQAKVKFEKGAIAQKDLADVETQHSSNIYNVVSAKNMHAQQVLKLKQLLELEPAVRFQIAEVPLDNSEADLPDLFSVYESAVQSLPDVKVFELQNNILDKELKIAKSGYLPSVSLNAGLNTGYTNTMEYNYFTQIYRNFSQQAGVSVSIPIFSQKQNKTNIALAKINLEQNELSKISAAKNLYAQVETAWQNAVANRAQQDAAESARDNAKLAYDLARKKYDFGALTTTELAVSRNSYLNAEQTYLQSKYLAELYRTLLDFYQGKTI